MKYDYIEPYITADIILEVLNTIRPRMADHEISMELNKKKCSPNNVRAALHQLVIDGYAKIDGNMQDWYMRTGEGALFTNKGGYKNHFEWFNEKEQKDAEMQIITNEKTKIDLANAKRVYKTYFSTRVMAIIATIVSLVLLFLKLAEVFGWIDKSK